MFEHLRKPPNLITALRLLAIPILWVLAFLKLPVLVGIGMLAAGLTDAFDGAVARRLDQASAFGSKFDSIADHSLQLSSVVWIFMLMPEVFSENQLLAFSALGMNLLSLLIGALKFKRFANLHLYLSKAIYPLFFIFIVHAFVSGRYSPVLLWIACGGIILASMETIILQLTRDQVDEHIGSILFQYLDEEHALRRFVRRLP